MSRRLQATSKNFVTVDRDWAQKVGASPAMPNLHMRIFLLAMSRLEPSWHAHFDQGELRGLLERGDRSGEVVKPSDRTVSRAIHDLIEWGIFGSGSWVRCLRVHTQTVEYSRSDTHNTYCPPKPAGRPANLAQAA